MFLIRFFRCFSFRLSICVRLGGNVYASRWEWEQFLWMDSFFPIAWGQRSDEQCFAYAQRGTENDSDNIIMKYLRAKRKNRNIGEQNVKRIRIDLRWIEWEINEQKNYKRNVIQHIIEYYILLLLFLLFHYLLSFRLRLEWNGCRFLCFLFFISRFDGRRENNS